MHNKKVIRKPLNVWKVISILTDNTEIKEDIETVIVNYLESNEKENTSDYNLQNTANSPFCSQRKHEKKTVFNQHKAAFQMANS